MDKIIFNKMQFYGYHGVFPEEAKLGQLFYVDVELYLDLRAAGASDRLEDTVNYAELYQLSKQLLERERYQLIEAVAEHLAARILKQFNRVQEVLVRITKPTPPIAGHYESVAVELRRSRSDAT